MDQLEVAILPLLRHHAFNFARHGIDMGCPVTSRSSRLRTIRSLCSSKPSPTSSGELRRSNGHQKRKLR